MSALFSPIALRELELANRVVVSPMCQYSSVDGCATDWHLMHLGQFAVSGAGLLFTEMTNVEPRGRISPRCMGLWSDDNEAAFARVVAFCREHGNVPIGVQLAHAGRKASTRPPWEGRTAVPPEEGGWRPVAPSAIGANADDAPPDALSREEVRALVGAFATATRRAARVGFRAIELHAAHGYLLHQFLSPLSNRRDDEYGGTLARRMRFPLEVFEAVRGQWPAERPLGVRVSATDWVEGGWTVEDTVAFAREVAALGCDWVDVSSGGLVAAPAIPVAPGYQVPFAERVRREAGVVTMTVGMITDPAQAEAIVADGRADLVALARGMLWDPHWTWHAAHALGAGDRIACPDQYLRALPSARGDTFADPRLARAAR